MKGLGIALLAKNIREESCIATSISIIEGEKENSLSGTYRRRLQGDLYSCHKYRTVVALSE
jgi:hypothetical protein